MKTYGFLLLLPFFLIRFGLLYLVNKEAIKRAAHYAPVSGNEMIASGIYQITNIVIFIYLILLPVTIEGSWKTYTGLTFYLIGLLCLVLSVINFAAPSEQGLNLNGVYRISRNPMYVSYLLFFIGCVLLTESLVLCGIVLIFQLSSHWIILAEERWCIEKFGKDYQRYMKKVRRYVGFRRQI